MTQDAGDYDGPMCGFALYGPPAACTCGECEDGEYCPHPEGCACAWCLDDELIP